MANIFTLSSLLGDEDRFTSSLNYLIELYPELGQEIADHILISSGKNNSEFIKAYDHPIFTYQDRPDFLIECKDIQIVCEHKIDAPLGEKQLERYLTLEMEKEYYVVLITSENCIVPEEVLSNSKYLRPTKSNQPYFRWQDIYPIIKRYDSKISQDFSEYMTSLGMKPWTSNILGDIFEDVEAANFFGQAWERTRSEFKNIGATCKIAPSKTGFEIGNPLPWLKLLYLSAKKQSKSQNYKVNGPYLMASIWVNEMDKRIITQSIDDIHFEYEFGDIYGEYVSVQAHWNKDMINVLQFYTPLNPLLSSDVKVMQVRLLSFSKSIFKYIETHFGAI